MCGCACVWASISVKKLVCVEHHVCVQVKKFKHHMQCSARDNIPSQVHDSATLCAPSHEHTHIFTTTPTPLA